MIKTIYHRGHRGNTEEIRSTSWSPIPAIPAMTCDFGDTKRGLYGFHSDFKNSGTSVDEEQDAFTAHDAGHCDWRGSGDRHSGTGPGGAATGAGPDCVDGNGPAVHQPRQRK